MLASALSLVILLIGFRGWTEMTVRQYPTVTSSVVTVTTNYPGASPATVKAFITTPLQQAIAGASGIDYMTSTSAQGRSTIIVNMLLNHDPDAAVAQILSKVNQVQNLLPAESQRPTINLSVGESNALIWVAFTSDSLLQQQVNDYVMRIAQPKIQGVPGVGDAQIVPSGNDPGGDAYALRAWLKPAAMAAHDLTASDVATALANNNFVAAVGSTRDRNRQVTITATTSLNELDEFRKLIVRGNGDTVIRLRDVADVELGLANYNQTAFEGGKTSVFIGIKPTPEGNALEVAAGVHRAMDELATSLPPGIRATFARDQSTFITASLREVLHTIVITLLVVVAVIFLFLGSLRSLLLPAVAIPLAVVGAGVLMLAFGFTINLLTLLAIVLAIGLVVDDAIIVLENIQRLIDEGAPPHDAAIAGARELAAPILVMSTTLVAVFIPIGFMSGLTGSLFAEFAFTLVATVAVSAIVALTLTPMLSSKVLRHTPPRGITHTLDRGFAWLRERYAHSLTAAMRARALVLLVGACLLAVIPILFLGSARELAPLEDEGGVLVQGTGPATATRSYLDRYNHEIYEALASFPETRLVWQISGVAPSNGAGQTAVFGGANLRDWSERSRSQMTLMALMQARLSAITGLDVVAFANNTLPGSSGGLPIQFVLTSAAEYAEIDAAAQDFVARAMQSGLFGFLTRDLRYDRPNISLRIDREIAAGLGMNMSGIGRDLGTLLSENNVSRFDMAGRSYEVIPQVPDALRTDANALGDYYTRTGDGRLVPLTTVVKVERSVQPEYLPQFQQLNSVTIQGMVAPGVTLGQALEYLEKLAANTLPAGYGVDYAGQSRQLVQQGHAILITFVLSILLVFLLLAAQFESFRDPLTVLAAVPTSVFGALVFLYLGAATLNIYTEVGLITLIGLITKQSILVVQFANVIQEKEGLDPIAAIEKASHIRLRPILMTTLAMIFGVVPLLVANGPGAVSRFQMGLVIASGLAVGALISLYLVPVIYTFIAKRRTPSEAATRGSGET